MLYPVMNACPIWEICQCRKQTNPIGQLPQSPLAAFFFFFLSTETIYRNGCITKHEKITPLSTSSPLLQMNQPASFIHSLETSQEKLLSPKSLLYRSMNSDDKKKSIASVISSSSILCTEINQLLYLYKRRATKPCFWNSLYRKGTQPTWP